MKIMLMGFLITIGAIMAILTALVVDALVTMGINFIQSIYMWNNQSKYDEHNFKRYGIGYRYKTFWEFHKYR